LIKNAKYLFVSIFLLIFSMALNFPFPHEYPLGQEVSSVFNIPITTTNGLSYIGVTALTLLFASLYFLLKSLEMFHVRMVLLALAAVVFIPPNIASGYQKTFATGIYAISYERSVSTCHFEMIDKKILYGTCNLPFENYSEHDVKFNIEFYDKYLLRKKHQ
jgi:hypothetical protein